MKIKLLLVDDHQLVRDGFLSILKDSEHFDMLGALGDGQQVLPFIRQLQQVPDIVLMDLDMPRLNGTQTTKKLKEAFPNIKVLILTMHDTTVSYNMAVAAKADGFMIKNADVKELMQAIDTIAKGGKHFPKRERQKDAFIETDQELVKLTGREKEVLKSIANGLSNKEIAEELGISHRTVDTHRTHLKEKLGVNGIAGLVRYAFKIGLVH